MCNYKSITNSSKELLSKDLIYFFTSAFDIFTHTSQTIFGAKIQKVSFNNNIVKSDFSQEKTVARMQLFETKVVPLQLESRFCIGMAFVIMKKRIRIRTKTT